MAPKSQKWTRASALNYLSNNPNFVFQKDPSAYSEAQLIRYARAYSQGEAVGRDISQEEARGHLASKVEYFPYGGKRQRLERHTIQPLKASKKPLTISDLKRLVQASEKAGHKPEETVYVVVSGIVNYRGVKQQWELSHYLTIKALKFYLKAHSNTYEDLLDFAEFVTGQPNWEQVFEIAIEYQPPTGGKWKN